MFAVVRLSGTVGIRKEISDTMRMLRLNHANECTLLPETESMKGMLQKCKDYVTWGEIDNETLIELLKKRLRMKKSNMKKVAENDLKEIAGYDTFEKFSQDLIEGKIKVRDFEILQPVFRLTPPSKGFKSLKEHFPRGEAGYRGKDINDLLRRMM